MKSKEKYLTSLADIKVKIVDEKGFVVGDNTMLVIEASIFLKFLIFLLFI